MAAASAADVSAPQRQQAHLKVSEGDPSLMPPKMEDVEEERGVTSFLKPGEKSYTQRCRLFVRNLPIDITEGEFSEVFINRDRGFGFIRLGKCRPIKILTRLTIIASDPSHCNVLRSTSPSTRLYDIVAVFPKTEKLFHAACTSIDVDLICINVTEKSPFFFRRPPINAAIQRGIFFELVYTPAIKDSTLRRYTISNALSLMQVCKGKNIIISSGAERALEMRGPYDIATLGLLFGLTEGIAKAAISTNCRSAVLHGETRKTAFGVVYTVKKTCLEEEEAEPVCKKAKKS